MTDNCPVCKTPLTIASGIGAYCAVESCPVLDDMLLWNEDGTPKHAPTHTTLPRPHGCVFNDLDVDCQHDPVCDPALFATPETPLSRFNDLVREAFDAQEAFDRWNVGYTLVDEGYRVRLRYCTLDEVIAEWDAANSALIMHVLAHGRELIKETAP